MLTLSFLSILAHALNRRLSLMQRWRRRWRRNRRRYPQDSALSLCLHYLLHSHSLPLLPSSPSSLLPILSLTSNSLPEDAPRAHGAEKYSPDARVLHDSNTCSCSLDIYHTTHAGDTTNTVAIRCDGWPGAKKNRDY